MEWYQQFPSDREPTLAQIGDFTQNPWWGKLCEYLEVTYQAPPRVEYSVCSAAPGWNVKYRKGSRALCTLYPRAGHFYCLVVVGPREAAAADLALPACTPYVRALFSNTKPMNGTRWLMIDITDAAVFEDGKRLIALRTGKREP